MNWACGGSELVSENVLGERTSKSGWVRRRSIYGRVNWVCQWMGEWVNEWMNVQVIRWMTCCVEWVRSCVSDWLNTIEYMSEWVFSNGVCVREWVSEWVYWVNKCSLLSKYNEWMSEWMFSNELSDEMNERVEWVRKRVSERMREYIEWMSGVSAKVS